MENVITLQSVVALSGSYPILSGVDLEVARGEIIFLQGSNGTGKTSLLRAIGGLVSISSGTIYILGQDLLKNKRVLRQKMGFLSHSDFLYEDLTIEENMRFYLKASGAGLDHIDQALDHMGLSGRLSKVLTSRLSVGQRRRAAIATLIARQCEIWLLDEPHAGLDADARDLLDSLITQASSQGVTIILSSHEANRAVELSTRVITMAGGHIVASHLSTSDEILIPKSTKSDSTNVA